MLVVSQAIGPGYSAVDGGDEDPWPWAQTVWTPGPAPDLPCAFEKLLIPEKGIEEKESNPDTRKDQPVRYVDQRILCLAMSSLPAKTTCTQFLCPQHKV